MSFGYIWYRSLHPPLNIVPTKCGVAMIFLDALTSYKQDLMFNVTNASKSHLIEKDGGAWFWFCTSFFFLTRFYCGNRNTGQALPPCGHPLQVRGPTIGGSLLLIPMWSINRSARHKTISNNAFFKTNQSPDRDSPKTPFWGVFWRKYFPGQPVNFSL